MPMNTQKDMSASEHSYKIKVWEGRHLIFTKKWRVINDTDRAGVVQGYAEKIKKCKD